MTLIKKDVFDQIIAHAKNDLPNEACGYLAGNEGLITTSYQLTNVDHSPEHFSFDPSEQFQVLKDTRSKGIQILANYHSHPSTPARPSEEDIRLAYDQSISYLIISLAGEKPMVNSFSFIDGMIQKEELIVTD